MAQSTIKFGLIETVNNGHSVLLAVTDIQFETNTSELWYLEDAIRVHCKNINIKYKTVPILIVIPFAEKEVRIHVFIYEKEDVEHVHKYIAAFKNIIGVITDKDENFSFTCTITLNRNNTISINCKKHRITKQLTYKGEHVIY